MQNNKPEILTCQTVGMINPLTVTSWPVVECDGVVVELQGKAVEDETLMRKCVICVSPATALRFSELLREVVKNLHLAKKAKGQKPNANN